MGETNQVKLTLMFSFDLQDQQIPLNFNLTGKTTQNMDSNATPFDGLQFKL
jgi:hypothetical protein